MFDNNTPPVVDQPTEVKFKVKDREYDIASAVSKIEHADNHISTLESELAALRAKQTLMEEQLKAKAALEAQAPAQTPAQATTSAGMSEDVVLSLVEQRLAEKQRQAQEEQNIQSVLTAAKTLYGDKALEELASKGAALGYTKDEVTKFAATKPEAFKVLFGLAQSQPTQKPAPKPGTSFTQPTTDDPYRNVAKLIVGKDVSARDRTAAIAALLKK